MATYKLKRKKADGTLEDVALAGSLPFIPSNAFTVVAGDSSTYLSIKWAVANVDGITTPTDGMSLALRIPAVGGIGILLSIDGGNKYYPIVRNVNNILSSQYATGCTLILTFNASQTAIAYFTAGTTTTVTGCWQIADYSDDRYVSQTYTTTNDVYPLLFRSNAGRTSTSNILSQTRYANNIYVNPATGTVYANDFVVDGKSIVGGGGGVRKLTSYTDTLSINSTTLGAYFNVFCNIQDADEVAIGDKTIALDSERTYFVTVDGMLATKANANANVWRVMVTVRDDSNSGYANTYGYNVTATSALNITHTGQYTSSVCSFTGIFCE